MKKLLQIIGLSLLFCSLANNAFSTGLDNDTKLLLHGCDPVTLNAPPDGSKEIVDSGNTGHIVTQVGDAVLQTITKKFGSSALTLDGTGDYLSIPDSADWDIFGNNTDNWTIDFWLNTIDFSVSCAMIGQGDDGNNHWDQ